MMRAARAKVDDAVVKLWVTEISAQADKSVRYLHCEDMIVIDFLDALRFRYQPSCRQLLASYRSPTGFWLDVPDSIILSAAAPLQWLWTKYWLAHRRAHISLQSPASNAAEFALLCEQYAKVLQKKLPLTCRRQLNKQLLCAMGSATTASLWEKNATRVNDSGKRQTFHAMLAAIASEPTLAM